MVKMFQIAFKSYNINLNYNKKPKLNQLNHKKIWNLSQILIFFNPNPNYNKSVSIWYKILIINKNLSSI